MISKLRGSWRGDHIDVSGVGYEVELLHETGDGEMVDVYIRSVWRETNGATLYGFATAAERAMFDAMCKVTRVGPNAAMSVLRSNGVGRVCAAIGANNPSMLAKSQGVGKKTMELICGYTKISPELLAGATSEEYTQDDVAEALVALGYGEKEAREAVREARSSGTSEEQDVLREALRIVRGNA
jgi:Holliday junction DNA helicase RuvA